MKQRIRTILFGTTAATSIGLTALVGCRSNDGDSSLAAKPDTGHVAAVMMKLSWPPGAAQHLDSSAGPPLPMVAAPPAKYPPVVYTQRPPAPEMSDAPSAPALGASPVLASSSTAVPQTGPDRQTDPWPAAAGQTVEAARPTHSSDMAPSGKAVANSESAKPANPDVHMASLSEQGNSEIVQASWSENSEPDLKKPPRNVASSTSKAALVPEVSPSTPAKSTPLPAASPDARAVGEPAFHIVNNKRIKLHFEVKDAGPSSIGEVEVWYVHDSREWRKPDITPLKKGPYVLEVEGEGLYGFKLIARNSEGLGEPAPRPGDAPQVWVLVDLTKPTVKINSAQVLQEADGARLEVAWSANDKHLGRRPVTLLYAEQPEGPWQPLVSNLEESGTLQKKLPPTMPKRFLVRVEALDIAGNLGADQTRDFLEIEPTRSRVSISRID